MYPCEFKADDGKKSGIAAFMVDGERFVVAIDSFDDCQMISKMLAVAENQGRRFSAFQMRDIVVNTANRECGRLAST